MAKTKVPGRTSESRLGHNPRPDYPPPPPPPPPPQPPIKDHTLLGGLIDPSSTDHSSLQRKGVSVTRNSVEDFEVLKSSDYKEPPVRSADRKFIQYLSYIVLVTFLLLAVLLIAASLASDTSCGANARMEFLFNHTSPLTWPVSQEDLLTCVPLKKEARG